MRKINSRRLLIGITLVATGIIVVGIGIAIGGPIGGTIIASMVAAATA